jgi:hypothetical protein
MVEEKVEISLGVELLMQLKLEHFKSGLFGFTGDLFCIFAL